MKYRAQQRLLFLACSAYYCTVEIRKVPFRTVDRDDERVFIVTESNAFGLLTKACTYR